MARHYVTIAWAASEAARAFLAAWGRRTRAFVAVDGGDLHVSAEVIPEQLDINEMRRRCVRAGRMLADAAQRKGIRTFFKPEVSPVTGATVASSEEMRVAVRVTPSYRLDRVTWLFDMRGTRRLFR